MPDAAQLQIIGTSNGHPWPNSLAERFSKSLAAHWPDLAKPRSLETLSRTIAEAAQIGIEAPLDQSFLTVAARAALIQAATKDVQSLISRCARICESPLELSFAIALGVVGRELTNGITFAFGDGQKEAENGPVLRVRPQERIAQFRVDFLLSLEWKSLIVEIDGWQFHDRNQDQAIRDKKRDRQLSTLGYSTFRFAGSEIWADVFGCAMECIDFLRSDTSQSQRKPPSMEMNGGQLAKAATTG